MTFAVALLLAWNTGIAQGPAVIQEPKGVTVREASVDLTPPEPLSLGGYTERKGALFEPGGEKLLARCVLLQLGQAKVALVAAEMLTMPESLVREVRTRLPESVFLFLFATHTHCAPDSQMLNERMTFSIPGIAKYQKKWLDWYADKIALSVLEAQKKQPEIIERFELRRKQIGFNQGRREGAKPSPHATMLLARLKAGKVIPLLSHYEAHATCWGRTQHKLSGDWPGQVMQKVGGLAMPGAIGDVSPKVEGTPVQTMEGISAAFDQLKQDKGVEFSTSWEPTLGFASIDVLLPKPEAHPEFSKTNKIPDALAQGLVRLFASEKAEIRFAILGSLVIVGIPGEPTSHLGRRIEAGGNKKIRGAQHVLVVSHVGGWAGYLLDEQDYLRGGYEATLSFYGPKAGDLFVDSALKLMRTSVSEESDSSFCFFHPS